MATKTSTTSGLFSAGATWVGGVAPADGDAFVIALGHTVTFDVDMSAYAGMAASVITGALVWKATTGTYVLKLAGHLTGTGTLTIGSAGTPYPATCLAKILFTGAYRINLTTQDAIQIFCTQPAVKTVKLTQAANTGATALVVDSDVSADGPWLATGATLRVDDSATLRPDSEERTISSIVGTTINVSSGLTSGKAVGSYVTLIYRNVQIIGAAANSGYAFYLTNGGNAQCMINTVFSSTYFANGLNFNGSISNVYAFGYFANASSFSGAYSYATSTGFQYAFGCVLDCVVGGCTYPVDSSANLTLGPNFRMHGSARGFTACMNVRGRNAKFENNNSDLTSSVYDSKFYNCLFGSTIENANYNNVATQRNHHYTESYDHDQVAGAFRCWTKGGITDKITSTKPTGKDWSFQHACESASYPCFRQIELSVEPGDTLRVDWWMQQSAALSIARVEILDAFADPLVDAANAALATANLGATVGSFVSGSLSWVNAGAARRPVLVRITGQNASGQNLFEYTEIDMSGFTAADRTKLEATHTALPAESAAISSLTAQAVRDAAKLAPTAGAPAAGSIDQHLDDIEADTGELQGELADGGRTDLILDGIAEKTVNLPENTGTALAAQDVEIAKILEVVQSK